MLLARPSLHLLALCCLAVAAFRPGLLGAPAPPAPRAWLGDIAARTRVTPTAPQILRLICVTSTPRPVLVRAVGRGLPGGDIAGTLPAPVLALQLDERILAEDRGSAVAVGIAAMARAVGAFPIAPLPRAPFANFGAALAPALGTGTYAFTTSSDDLGSGVVLVEARALDTAAGPLVRGFTLVGETGPGDALMIVGFVVSGEAPLRLRLRGVSPALRRPGVTGTVNPTRLELHAAGAAAPLAQASQRTHHGATTLEAALAPGAYTVQLTPGDGRPGLATLEVIAVDE